jgi:hypothetical protein
METKTGICRLCPCKILVVSHPTMAIRPWLGEPRQTFCQPAGLASQSYLCTQTRRVDTMNAGATKSPGSLCSQRLSQTRRVDTIRCRSDAPCRESFAGYLTYAKITRTTRPGRCEVRICLVLLYGYETLSCSSPNSTQVGRCALCYLVSRWEIFFKNFEKFSCN